MNYRSPQVRPASSEASVSALSATWVPHCLPLDSSQMGSSHAEIVQVQVWLADMADWPEFVPLWNGWIDGDAPPGLSVVTMPASRRDALIEIRAWAMRPDPAAA